MPGGVDFGLSQIGQISMNVHDLDRAIEFYRDRLRVKQLFTVPKMAFFDCAGTHAVVRLRLGGLLQFLDGSLYRRARNKQDPSSLVVLR